jgi:putative lipoic acid-binding regulatory protein
VTTVEPPSLIEFPSLFPIKVMGANDPGFEQAMVDVVLRFDPGYDHRSLQIRHSRGGKYLGLTLSVTATSREQLDALYRALSSHPLVKMVL